MRRPWRVMPAMALLVASLSVLLSAWLFKLNAERTDQIGAVATRADSAAARANGAAGQAKRAVSDVQDSRLEACEQANERHDETLAEFDKQVAKLPPRRRARANARKAGTVALLEAISPHRDCEALVEPPPATP